MKLLRLAALAAGVMLAACTSTPTGSTHSDTATPSYDGGNTLGSGHYAGGEDAYGFDSVASDTTGRGGNGLGSGN
jgi:hypothetical protein